MDRERSSSGRPARVFAKLDKHRDERGPSPERFACRDLQGRQETAAITIPKVSEETARRHASTQDPLNAVEALDSPGSMTGMEHGMNDPLAFASISLAVALAPLVPRT
jgi:hypothetical protein